MRIKQNIGIADFKQVVLVLTGTINSNKFQNTGNLIQDTDQRLKEYSNALEFYIKDSPFQKIVFGENSGYSFDYEYFVRMATLYNKQFEFIPCITSVRETVKRGKSFGEFSILKQVVENSKLLESNRTFLKVTGRLILENIDHLYRSEEMLIGNRFYTYNSKHWCFTNIFQLNVEDFKKYFLPYESIVNEKAGQDIERVFYKVLRDNQQYLQPNTFHCWPSLTGLQGATLQPYKKPPFEMFLRNLLASLGLFKFRYTRG